MEKLPARAEPEFLERMMWASVWLAWLAWLAVGALSSELSWLGGLKLRLSPGLRMRQRIRLRTDRPSKDPV